MEKGWPRWHAGMATVRYNRGRRRCDRLSNVCDGPTPCPKTKDQNVTPPLGGHPLLPPPASPRAPCRPTHASDLHEHFVRTSKRFHKDHYATFWILDKCYLTPQRQCRIRPGLDPIRLNRPEGQWPTSPLAEDQDQGMMGRSRAGPQRGDGDDGI